MSERDDAELGRILMRYIDRLTDPCPEDANCVVVAELSREVNAAVMRHRAAPIVGTFARKDGRSGGNHRCDNCGKPWTEHICPGSKCPTDKPAPDQRHLRPSASTGPSQEGAAGSDATTDKPAPEYTSSELNAWPAPEPRPGPSNSSAGPYCSGSTIAPDASASVLTPHEKDVRELLERDGWNAACTLIDRLTRELADMGESYIGAQQLFIKSEEARDRIRADHEIGITVNQELRAERDRLRAELATAETSINKMLLEMTGLRRELAEARAERDRITLDRDAKSKRMWELGKECEAAEAERDKLQLRLNHAFETIDTFAGEKMRAEANAKRGREVLTRARPYVCRGSRAEIGVAREIDAFLARDGGKG